MVIDGVAEDFSLGAGGDGEFRGEEGVHGITGAVFFCFRGGSVGGVDDTGLFSLTRCRDLNFLPIEVLRVYLV